MSTDESEQSVSVNSVMYPRDVVELIVAALPPGMVKSVLLCANLAGGSVSGVVEDADEPGGGYISEWELADRAVYLVLGVDVTSDCAGVMQLDSVGGVVED